jgi:alkylhydroperoxidase family enzyme
MHLTFGQHPELYAAWLPFAVHVMPNSTLEPRHRQLLILRTSYAWQAPYPWSHHARISKLVSNLTDAEIEATVLDLDRSAWSPLELALLRACDETRSHGAIQEATWQLLARELGQRELLDVVFTVGQYALIATALNSLRVELDEGFSLPAWVERVQRASRAAGPSGGGL